MCSTDTLTMSSFNCIESPRQQPRFSIIAPGSCDWVRLHTKLSLPNIYDAVYYGEIHHWLCICMWTGFLVRSTTGFTIPETQGFHTLRYWSAILIPENKPVSKCGRVCNLQHSPHVTRLASWAIFSVNRVVNGYFISLRDMTVSWHDKLLSELTWMATGEHIPPFLYLV